MSPKQKSQLRKLGVFTLAQARRLGIDQPRISRLVKNGLLNRVSRGLYIHPEASVSQDVGFQIAFAKFGSRSAIGGLSALFHYGLIEQVPVQTWVIVPQGKLSREPGYRLMRTKSDLNTGVIEGNGYKIVTVERAILEGLKFSSKIGERTALTATRVAIARKQTTESKLGKAAKELGLTPVLAKYFEAIIA